MKTYLKLLVVASLIFSSCNTPQGSASRTYNDDIYYSSADAKTEQEKNIAAAKIKADEEKRRKAAEDAEKQKELTKQEEAEDYYKSPEKRNDENGNTYVTNNYYDQPFDYDDYYDYEYTARLRRFHSPAGNYGYYDNYYTNSYWYSGNPYNYGSSIYMGYNFWGPSYNSYSYYPSVSYYSSWGWCYDPWYNPWGYNYGYYNNPYAYGYGYGNPYMNGYANGYNQGYYDGFYNGYYNNSNYFNSFDNNSYYYGPRRTTTSNNRTSVQPSLAHKYVSEIENETNVKPGTINSREDLAQFAPQYINTSRPNQPTNVPSIKEDGRNSPRPNNGSTGTTRPIDRPIQDSREIHKPSEANPFPDRQTPVFEQPKNIPDPQRPQPHPRQNPTAPREQKKEQPRFEQPRQDAPRQNNQVPAPRNQNSGTPAPRKR